MTETIEHPKWKRFEKFVASIQKQLAPNAVVKHDDKIIGKSGATRQIDISIRINAGQMSFLAVLDCKDWKDPVDIKAVEEFIGLVEDVGANKGAIVCNAGFSETAKNKAQQKGVDLFLAVDAESKDWPVYMALPTLCDFRGIKKYSFIFRHSAPTPFMMPSIDPRYLEVYNKDGEMIDLLANLFAKAWNDGKIKDEPGENIDLSFLEVDAYTKVDGVVYGPVEIKANVIIGRRLFFGQLPLSEGRGFKDEITGSFTTRSITTDSLDVVEVEKTWRRLEDESELSVKPVFVLVASDQYPLIKVAS